MNWDILVTFGENISETFTVASPSCWWREVEEQFMSTYGKVTYPSIFTLKRTVSVILIDPQYKDGNARFTIVSL